MQEGLERRTTPMASHHKPAAQAAQAAYLTAHAPPRPCRSTRTRPTSSPSSSTPATTSRTSLGWSRTWRTRWGPEHEAVPLLLLLLWAPAAAMAPAAVVPPAAVCLLWAPCRCGSAARHEAGTPLHRRMHSACRASHLAARSLTNQRHQLHGPPTHAKPPCSPAHPQPTRPLVPPAHS
jgi:hypothetical protein